MRKTYFISEYAMLYYYDFGIRSAPISTNFGYGIALLVSLAFAFEKTGVKVSIYESLFLPLAFSLISYFTAKKFFCFLDRDLHQFLNLCLSLILGSLIYGILTLIFRRKFAREFFKFVVIHKK